MLVGLGAAWQEPQAGLHCEVMERLQCTLRLDDPYMEDLDSVLECNH